MNRLYVSCNWNFVCNTLFVKIGNKGNVTQTCSGGHRLVGLVFFDLVIFVNVAYVLSVIEN